MTACAGLQSSIKKKALLGEETRTIFAVIIIKKPVS